MLLNLIRHRIKDRRNKYKIKFPISDGHDEMEGGSEDESKSKDSDHSQNGM